MSHLRPATPRLSGAGLRVVVVASRFNEPIVSKLIEGAREALDEAGVGLGERRLVRVAGAWEIPLALEAAARGGEVDALVALGAVVRGDTPHFDYVAGECSRGCMDVSLRHALPVGFGVLTCDTMDQAMERAGGRYGNKGAEAVEAAIDAVRAAHEAAGG